MKATPAVQRLKANGALNVADVDTYNNDDDDDDVDVDQSTQRQNQPSQRGQHSNPSSHNH